MASGRDSGESRLRSSQRQSKKREYADYITHTPGKHETRKQTEQCNNCNDIFTNKKSLAAHEKKCLALTAHDSFGKHIFNKKPYDTSGKVLVSSQPLASPPPRTPPPTPTSPSTPLPTPPSAPQRPTPLTPRTYATAITATVKLVPLKRIVPQKVNNTTSSQQKQATTTNTAGDTNINQPPTQN